MMFILFLFLPYKKFFGRQGEKEERASIYAQFAVVMHTNGRSASQA